MFEVCIHLTTAFLLFILICLRCFQDLLLHVGIKLQHSLSQDNIQTKLMSISPSTDLIPAVDYLTDPAPGTHTVLSYTTLS